MKTNDKVVCINDKPLPGCGNNELHLIKEGEIYTIREIIDCGYFGKGIHLNEVYDTSPAGFHIQRFREIDENFGKEVIENIESQLIQEEIPQLC